MSCRGLYPLVVMWLISASVSRTASATPFVNLNFELATVPPGTPAGTLPASVAFPGWTVRLNDFPLEDVYYNFGGIGEPQVVLYDTTFVPGLGNTPIMEGRFGAILIPSPSGSFSASVTQFADVPVASRSIRILVQHLRFPPQVFLNGVEIPLVHLSDPRPGSVAEYGGDVTALDGMSAELTLMRQQGIAVFDNVTFSATPIPEPRALAVAYGMIAWYHNSRCLFGTRRRGRLQ